MPVNALPKNEPKPQFRWTLPLPHWPGGCCCGVMPMAQPPAAGRLSAMLYCAQGFISGADQVWRSQKLYPIRRVSSLSVSVTAKVYVPAMHMFDILYAASHANHTSGLPCMRAC